MSNCLTIDQRKVVEGQLFLKMIGNTDVVQSYIMHGGQGINRMSDDSLLATYHYHFGEKHDSDPSKEVPTSQQWKDAALIGVTWDANWMPGGPALLYQVSAFARSEESTKRVWESIFNYEQFHHGFRAGFEERLRNADFKKWWDENHGKKPQTYKASAQ
jgi:hypothetical protein